MGRWRQDRDYVIPTLPSLSLVGCISLVVSCQGCLPSLLPHFHCPFLLTIPLPLILSTHTFPFSISLPLPLTLSLSSHPFHLPFPLPLSLSSHPFHPPFPHLLFLFPLMDGACITQLPSLSVLDRLVRLTVS